MLVEKLVPAIPTTFRGTRAIQQNLFSLLQNCSTIKDLTQIHTHIIINGLTQKSYLLVRLISLCVDSGYLSNAQRVFQQIDNPSTTIWNQMIRGLAQSETPCQSIEFFSRMVKTHFLPDEFTYCYAIKACARSGLLGEGEKMHGRVISNGFCSNMFVQTNLVNLYAIAGVVDNACQVFDEMSERSVVTWNALLMGFIKIKDIDAANRVFREMPEKDVMSWTTMIAGCAQNGSAKKAISLFNKMGRSKAVFDQVTLVAALSACAQLGDLNLGRLIHSYTFRFRNQPILVSLSNALLYMYASCGAVDEAYKVFLAMPERTSVSWTSMITSFAKQGHGEEALRIFNEMQCSSGSEAKPDEITFIGVLYACSHAGLIEKGRHLFTGMKEIWGIKPRVQHYGCMIDLLSRAGLLDEACMLVESMPMKPNDAIWGAILNGCRIHKNVEIASHLDQNLAIEIGPEKAAGYLVLLSNLYAASRMWKDVAVVRERMVKMGASKSPGRSWVQIDGVVHDFVAGDGAHSHGNFIYGALNEITEQAKSEGYESEILEVLLDI